MKKKRRNKTTKTTIHIYIYSLEEGPPLGTIYFSTLPTEIYFKKHKIQNGMHAHFQIPYRANKGSNSSKLHRKIEIWEVQVDDLGSILDTLEVTLEVNLTLWS